MQFLNHPPQDLILRNQVLLGIVLYWSLTASLEIGDHFFPISFRNSGLFCFPYRCSLLFFAINNKPVHRDDARIRHNHEVTFCICCFIHIISIVISWYSGRMRIPGSSRIIGTKLLGLSFLSLISMNRNISSCSCFYACYSNQVCRISSSSLRLQYQQSFFVTLHTWCKYLLNTHHP